MRACVRACSAYVTCLVNEGVNRCISGSDFFFLIHAIRVALIDVLLKSFTHESMNE